MENEREATFQGTIESVETKGKLLNVKIAGQRYSIWDTSLQEELLELCEEAKKYDNKPYIAGVHTEKQNGQYLNKTIQQFWIATPGGPVSPVTTPRPAAPRAPPRAPLGEDPKELYWQAKAAADREKNMHIVRMNSWAHAVTLVTSGTVTVETKNNLENIRLNNFESIRLLAHEIEKDITRAGDFKPGA